MPSRDNEWNMARNKTKIYPCHICGTKTKLSYEHIPPRAAFNNRPVVEGLLGELIKSDKIGGSLKGKTLQRGGGGYTLCEKCNNNTGSWYGKDYVDWVEQTARILMESKINPSIYCLYNIFPLRVIKQIVCMFFSVNANNFKDVQKELVRFVLNKDAVGIEPQIHIYCFLNPSKVSRQSGVSGLLDFKKHRTKIISEIIFFPFGYILSLNEIKPDDRLAEITFFSGYHYNERKEIHLKLPYLPIYSYLPGDYRNEQEITAHHSET